MYDKEDLIFDVVNLFKNNLNTEIGVVNTAKGNVPVLTTIDSSAFFIQEAGEASMNYPQYVFFYVSFPSNESIASSSVEEISITVLMVINDDVNLNYEMLRKLLRYQRAMKAVVEKNFRINANGNDLIVKGVEPVLLADQDSNILIKTCGIEIRSFIN